MANRRGSKQIAPMIRGAFIRAVKALEDGGTPLSTIIEKQLKERPLETLDASIERLIQQRTVIH